VIGSGFGDGDEHIEFQGDGGANGLSATQTDMTSLHWTIFASRFKAQRCREPFYLYAVVNAAASPRLYLVRNPGENLEPEENLEVVRYVAGQRKSRLTGK
jgi:hypothetical protein